MAVHFVHTAAPEVDTTRGAIYQRLGQLSRPMPAPRAWSFLGAARGIRQCCWDPAAVLTALRVEFSECELEGAGVVVQGSEGNLELAPSLCGENRPFFLLYRTKDSLLPYAAVGPDGCLGREEPPCFIAAYDFPTGNHLANSGRNLFLAFDMADVVVLRQLELPATLAVGLDELDGQQLERLCGPPFGPDRHEPIPDSLAVRKVETCWQACRLILVGWSLATLAPSEPPGLHRVVSLLAGRNVSRGLRQLRYEISVAR